MGNDMNAKSLLENGMKYFQAKSYDSAIENFKKVVTLYPQSSLADNAHYNLGIIYSIQGSYNKAFVELKIIIEEYPNSDAAIFAPDKLDEIKERIDPSSPLFMEGMAAVRKSDFETARAKFTKVIENYPSGELIDNALFSLAAIEYKSGNSDLAKALLEKVLSDHSETDAAKLIKDEDILNHMELLSSLIS